MGGSEVEKAWALAGGVGVVEWASGLSRQDEQATEQNGRGPHRDKGSSRRHGTGSQGSSHVLPASWLTKIAGTVGRS